MSPIARRPDGGSPIGPEPAELVVCTKDPSGPIADLPRLVAAGREERSRPGSVGDPRCSPSVLGSLGRVFERMADRSRRVLVLALEEARLLDHSFIGTEHILLGLISEGEGIAAHALGELGLSLDVARARVEVAIGLAGAGHTDSPPFTPRAKKMLDLSQRVAVELGSQKIGTEHLLLGLVREGEGVGAQVLQSFVGDLSRVRQQVMALLSDRQGRQPAGQSSAEELAAEPLCPHCRARLADAARSGTVALASESTDPQGDRKVIDVVFCGRCGTTLGTLPPDVPRSS
jgi:Clp amino terminal domain, pathogenicity island component